VSYGGGAPPWVYKRDMANMQISHDQIVRTLNEKIKELESEIASLKEENKMLKQKLKESESHS